MLSLEQVVNDVYNVLLESDISTHPAYPGRTVDKIALIREVYMEHALFPGLTVRSIVRRRITGLMTVEETVFWQVYLERRHRP